ncbi:MAG TPA: lipocalin family protein, partial [Candidatus Acidoferrales bacterium]|nr:lipocalin family protein [Candidatus Acidoferrales bacterium]
GSLSSAPNAWTFSGHGGLDGLTAGMTEAEAAAAGGSFGFALALQDVKGSVLHDGDGWVDFGPAGGSYYYSRPRMAARGTLTLDGQQLRVTGSVWFDHQWGDFISVGGGGWDWFAVNLSDGTDLTLSLVRNADGSLPLVYGTIVDATGEAAHLGPHDFTVAATGSWTSPTTGIAYPSGWRLTIPGKDLTIDLVPTLPNQELDTRATTGVVYWEGSQVVRASRAGTNLDGEAYVELTGYGPPTP